MWSRITDRIRGPLLPANLSCYSHRGFAQQVGRVYCTQLNKTGVHINIPDWIFTLWPFSVERSYDNIESALMLGRGKYVWNAHEKDIVFFYFQLDTVQSKLKTRSVCGKKTKQKKKTSFLSFWSMLRDTLWLSNYSSWNGTRVIYLRFRRGFYRRCVYLLETSFVYKECRIIDTPSYHKHLVFLTGTDAGRTK